MWNGDLLAGPVPTLFADTPDVAVDALNADMAKVHYDLKQIHRVLFGPKHVDVKEAALVKKPR
jgi:hypothetical protein